MGNGVPTARYADFATDLKRPARIEGSLADKIQIFEKGQLIASHPVLEGRRQRSLLDGHRKRGRKCEIPMPPALYGDLVTCRPLDFYDAIGKRLAASGGMA